MLFFWEEAIKVQKIPPENQFSGGFLCDNEPLNAADTTGEQKMKNMWIILYLDSLDLKKKNSRNKKISNWLKAISRYFIVVKTKTIVMFVKYELKIRAQRIDHTNYPKDL